MAEILTESFCERCGTRYTFQTAAPRRGRLARIRVATKGLRNYVLEDGSSLEDAFNEARNEEERAVSGQQLEAFHQTFNFCLSCRQYTCGNCWNTAENRCLSCAPDLSRELMPAPLPDLAVLPAEPAVAPERAALAALAWPEADLARAEEPTVEPELEQAVELAAPAETEAEAAPAPAVDEATTAEPALVVETTPAPELAAVAQLSAAEPETEAPTAVEPAMPEETPARLDAGTAAAAAALAAATSETEAAPEPEPTEPHERAAKAAAATTLLLGRFRPGQSLDAALDAYERGEPIPAEPAAAAEPEPADAAALAAAAAAAEPIAAEPEPIEPIAAEPEPAPPAAAPEPEAATEPEAPTPTEPPAPAPRRDDRVELPVWTIVAPDAQAPAPGAPPTWPTVVPPPAPGTPAWPSGAWAAPEPPNAAIRAREAMWAESSRDVVGRATTGVQACVSCGLQLSATARFCRRCGTRQG